MRVAGGDAGVHGEQKNKEERERRTKRASAGGRKEEGRDKKLGGGRRSEGGGGRRAASRERSARARVPGSGSEVREARYIRPSRNLTQPDRAGGCIHKVGEGTGLALLVSSYAALPLLARRSCCREDLGGRDTIADSRSHKLERKTAARKALRTTDDARTLVGMRGGAGAGLLGGGGLLVRRWSALARWRGAGTGAGERACAGAGVGAGGGRALPGAGRHGRGGAEHGDGRRPRARGGLESERATAAIDL